MKFFRFYVFPWPFLNKTADYDIISSKELSESDLNILEHSWLKRVNMCGQVILQ